MIEELQKIEKSKADPTVRIARRVEVGDVFHQGDVYLHRASDHHPRGRPWGSRQVAVGQQIGARHVVEGAVAVYAGVTLPPGVTAPAWVDAGALLGPVVVAADTFRLTHPEHAHHRLPAGVYQVTYQADYSTRRRVVD
jgi:hypothetical protein